MITVPDVEDHEVIRRLPLVTDPRVRVLGFEHRGERSALGVGIRTATGEVVVLVDSDTRWEEGPLDAVQMPFADPTVGGVGTRQNVYRRHSGVWRRIADRLVDLRSYDYVPAMGRAGTGAGDVTGLAEALACDDRIGGRFPRPGLGFGGDFHPGAAPARGTAGAILRGPHA